MRSISRSRKRVARILARGASALAIAGCAGTPHSPEPSMRTSAADVPAVRAARLAQNRAIAAGDADRVAEFWTEDVEIRRALGQLIVGRNAYRELFAADNGRDSALIYQREPTRIEVSPQWPLAYESEDMDRPFRQRVDGPVVIQDRMPRSGCDGEGRG